MNIPEAIKAMSGAGNHPAIKVCTVKAVDKGAYSCDCSPVDGSAPFSGVRLRASMDDSTTGIVAFPVVGSSVLVGIIEGDHAAAVVLTVLEIDEWQVDTGNAVLNVKPDGSITWSFTTMKLGKPATAQPMPLGTSLNTNLTELTAQLIALLTAIAAYATAQVTAIGAIPALLPLLPGYTALVSAVAPIAGMVAALPAKYPTHLSSQSFTS